MIHVVCNGMAGGYLCNLPDAGFHERAINEMNHVYES